MESMWNEEVGGMWTVLGGDWQDDEWVHFLALSQLPVANHLPARVTSYPRSQSVTNNIRYILLRHINVRADFYVFKLVLVAIIRI